MLACGGSRLSFGEEAFGGKRGANLKSFYKQSESNGTLCVLNSTGMSDHACQWRIWAFLWGGGPLVVRGAPTL